VVISAVIVKYLFKMFYKTWQLIKYSLLVEM